MAVDRQAIIEDLLSQVDEILDNAKSVPFSDKIMIEKNSIVSLINEIRESLPGELEQSRWILEDRDRIIADAEKEAQARLEEAEEERDAMVNENEITRRAYAQAEEIVEASKKVAREMRMGAKEYADDILQQVDEQMKRMGDFTSGSIEKIMAEYQENVRSFNEALDQKRQILQNNRKELNVSRISNSDQ